MLNEARVQKSLVRLAKNIGLDILTVPLTVFSGENTSPPAYTNADGIFIHSNVVNADPDNIEVYLAHEIFHHVVEAHDLTGQYPSDLLNYATDYKINYLINRLYGYHVRQVKYKGLYSAKYGKLSVKDIADAILKKHHLKLSESCSVDFKQIPHPLILSCADKIKRNLDLDKQVNHGNLFFLDLEEEQIFNNSLAAFRKSNSRVNFATSSIPSTDILKVIKGVWSQLFLKEVTAACSDSTRKFSNEQALTYCFPGYNFRELTLGKADEALFASIWYLCNVDDDVAYITFKCESCKALIIKLISKINSKLRSPRSRKLPSLRYLRKRLSAVKESLVRWRHTKPVTYLLDHNPVPVHQNRQQVQVVTASLKSKFAVDNKSAFSKEVKLPGFPPSHETAKRIRAVSRRSFQGTAKSLEILERLLESFTLADNIGDSNERESQSSRNEGLQNNNNGDQGKGGESTSPSNSGGNRKESERLSQGSRREDDEGDSEKGEAPTNTIGISFSSKTKFDLLENIHSNLSLLDGVLYQMQEIEQLFFQSSSRRTREFGLVAQNLAYGNDIQTMVPSELGLYSNKETKLAFLAKLAEGTLLVYNPPDPRRYPVIVCVDGSGSMKGSFYQIASGFALALLKRLHRDHRGFGLVMFSSVVDGYSVIEGNSPIDVNKSIELICTPTYGGTNFDKPVLAALDIKDQARWKNVVILLVSDGEGVLAKQDEIRARMSRDDKLLGIFVSKETEISGFDQIYHVSKNGGNDGLRLELAKVGSSLL